VLSDVGPMREGQWGDAATAAARCASAAARKSAVVTGRGAGAAFGGKTVTGGPPWTFSERCLYCRWLYCRWARHPAQRWPPRWCDRRRPHG